MALRREQDPVLLPPGGPGGGGSPGNPNPGDEECCLDGGCSSSRIEEEKCLNGVTNKCIPSMVKSGGRSQVIPDYYEEWVSGSVTTSEGCNVEALSFSTQIGPLGMQYTAVDVTDERCVISSSIGSDVVTLYRNDWSKTITLNSDAGSNELTYWFMYRHSDNCGWH